MKEMTSSGRTGQMKQTELLSSTARHYEESAFVPTSVEQVFDYVDDHARLSSHMRESSWMMGGGRMDIQADAGNGQAARHGRQSGLRGFLSSATTEWVSRSPPRIAGPS